MEVKQLIPEWWTGQRRNWEESKKKILELNKDENTTKQNIWNTVKVVLREKFVSLSGYTKESERT